MDTIPSEQTISPVDESLLRSVLLGGLKEMVEKGFLNKQEERRITPIIGTTEIHLIGKVKADIMALLSDTGKQTLDTYLQLQIRYEAHFCAI